MAASVSTKSAGVLSLQPPSALSASKGRKEATVVIVKKKRINQLSNGVGNSKSIDITKSPKVKVVVSKSTVDYEKLIREKKLIAAQHKKIPVAKPPLSQTFKGSMAVRELIKSCEEYANKMLTDSLLKDVPPTPDHPDQTIKFTLSSKVHQQPSSTSNSVIFRVPRSAGCTKSALRPPTTNPLPIERSRTSSVHVEQLSLRATTTASKSDTNLRKNVVVRPSPTHQKVQSIDQAIQINDQPKAIQQVVVKTPSTTSSSVVTKRPTLIFLTPTFTAPVQVKEEIISQTTPSIVSPCPNSAVTNSHPKEKAGENISGGVQSSSSSSLPLPTTDFQESANQRIWPTQSKGAEGSIMKKARFGCLWVDCDYQDLMWGNVQSHVRRKHFHVPLTQKEQEQKGIFDPEPVTTYIASL